VTSSYEKPELPAPTHPVGATVTGYSLARDAFGREIVEPAAPVANATPAPDATTRKEMATDAIGRRAGALSDELDFPAFVASLMHGTFDAMVDSSIRQMQAFADLVAAVAKPLEQFTQENVSVNQARDYLVEQHPRDIALASSDGEMTLVPVTRPTSDDGFTSGDDDAASPRWLADYGHDGAQLTPEFLEQELLPVARARVARSRLQTLSTMVLLGMNRIVIKDGTIGARLRFRAAAADHAAVQYATSGDPATGGESWGRRAGSSEPPATTKVSTVGVNVQSDSELKAELFGEVKINFASETLPLDRFIDEAKRTLLEGHSRSAHSPRETDAARRVSQPALAAPATPVAQLPPAIAVAPAAPIVPSTSAVPADTPLVVTR
jgi:hypothetical protein